MFERFTERARTVMALSKTEAQRFNHEYIGTEHILLGMVHEGRGVGATVLKNLGADLARVRAEVEKRIKAGPNTVSIGKRPYTPHAIEIVKHAIEESRGLGHNCVGTEHLLLGLLNDPGTVAAVALAALGLSLEQVRGEVLSLLGDATLPVEGIDSGDLDGVLGPTAIDSQVRGIVTMCWMMLPKERRTVDGVKAQMRRLMERALRDFEEDAEAFPPSQPKEGQTP